MLIFQLFMCCLFLTHIKNIQRKMKLQDKINRTMRQRINMISEINGLLARRVDAISEQSDTLFEMIKLESKRLDVYDKDDDADWWKKG